MTDLWLRQSALSFHCFENTAVLDDIHSMFDLFERACKEHIMHRPDFTTVWPF
jgi:hypothetical protein